MMLRALLALISLLIVLATSPAYAVDEGPFEVTELQGQAYFWPRFGLEWVPLHIGDMLARQSLVKLAAGTLLVARPLGEDAVSSEMGLKADAVMVTRFEPKNLKRPRLRGYFAGFGSEVRMREPPDSAFRRIEQAWNRAISLFESFRKKKGERHEALAGRPGVGSNGRLPGVRELPLAHPADGSTFVVDGPTRSLPVAWQAEPEIERYRVYFWAPVESSAQAIAMTRDNFYWIPVPKGGQYYVRIESDDGKWRSRAHLVVVANPLQRRVPEAH